MKFFSLAVSYLKKHWSLLIASLVAGVAVSVAHIGGGFFAYLNQFFTYGDLSFYEVYSRISPIIGSWWGTLLALLVLAGFFAYIVGVIDRHMKIGEFRLGSPMRKINENLSFILIFLVVFLLIEELVNVLVALASAAVMSVAAPVVAYLITILAYVVIQGVAIIFFVMGALWVPESIITGMSMRDSFSAALEKGKGHVGKMLIGALLCAVPAFLVSMAGAFVGPAIRVIFNAVSATAIIAYIPVFVFTAYYEISDLEREDLSPAKNFWKR